jgi:hypothetical protein
MLAAKVAASEKFLKTWTNVGDLLGSIEPGEPPQILRHYNKLSPPCLNSTGPIPVEMRSTDRKTVRAKAQPRKAMTPPR